MVSITADTLTLKMTDGQTIAIPITATTTYRQESNSTAGTVTAGKQVLVALSGGRFGGGGQGNGGPAASGAPGGSAAGGESGSSRGRRAGGGHRRSDDIPTRLP